MLVGQVLQPKKDLGEPRLAKQGSLITGHPISVKFSDSFDASDL